MSLTQAREMENKTDTTAEKKQKNKTKVNSNN